MWQPINKKTTQIAFFCTADITAVFTCDDEMEMFADGVRLGKDNNWRLSTEYVIPGNTRVISVSGKDNGYDYGILGSLSNGMITNASWKCKDHEYPRWNFPDFDDSNWPAAVVVAKHGDSPWGNRPRIASNAKWIWTAGENDQKVYCRLKLQ